MMFIVLNKPTVKKASIFQFSFEVKYGSGY